MFLLKKIFYMIIMYEKQNKQYAFNVFPERHISFCCLHSRKKLEDIRICFSSGMFVLLRRHRKSS